MSILPPAGQASHCLQEDLRQFRRGLLGVWHSLSVPYFQVRGGVGWDLGQGQTQGLFYGQSGTQYHAVPDHLQSFCWPVLLIPSKLFEGEEKFKMKR